MLKKIQQYLLLNYPLLWNIKIVPAFLGAVVINILFFLAGYFLTKIDFSDRYSYSSSFPGAALIYMGAVLTAILLFIIWLVFYSKKNAFKSFYPKSSSGLYLEWVLSFVIICGFILFPFSYYQGSASKVRSYVSKQEMIKAVETLNLIRILIPTDKTSYYQEYPTDLPSDYYMKSAPDKHSGNLDSSASVAEYVDPVEYAESNNVHYPDYPDFAQLSLLNYGSLNQFYISSKSDFTIRDADTVKKWLRQQNKEEISRLIESFFAVQNKHNLKTNLTKDQWLQLVYNPSKYPVGDFNLITSYNYEDEEAKNEYSYYYSSRDNTPNGYYVSYDELERSYSKIMDAYVDKDGSLAFFIISITMALSISLLVFSFRSTTGKSWLIALISIGLILFINGILSFAISSPFRMDIVGLLFYIFVLLIIFSLELISVLRKNMSKKAKSRSDIYINHLIWFVPAVPALIFMAIYIIGHNQYSYNDYTYDNNRLYETYLFMDEHIIEFIWANICLTFVSMWFFIQVILRKWKSLPEQ